MGCDLMAFLTIPLHPSAESFDVTIAKRRIRLVTRYYAHADAGWTLDILEPDGAAIVLGIPIVTGDDLLRGYKHLFAASMYYVGHSDMLTTPSYDSLGVFGELVVDFVG